MQAEIIASRKRTPIMQARTRPIPASIRPMRAGIRPVTARTGAVLSRIGSSQGKRQGKVKRSVCVQTNVHQRHGIRAGSLVCFMGKIAVN